MDDPFTEATALKRRWAVLARAIRAGYVIAVVVAVAWAIISTDFLAQGQVLGSLMRPAGWAFIAAWCVMVVMLGWLWRLWVEWRYGVTLRAAEWLHAQAMAWSGRYLPGKLGLMLGKLAVARDRLGWRKVGRSVLVEQMAFVAAGIFTAVLLMPSYLVEGFDELPRWVVSGWPIFRPLIAAGTVCAFILGLRVLDGITTGETDEGGAHPGLGRRVVLLGLYVAPHVLVGIAFYALVLATSSGTVTPSIAHCIAILALAHVAGILAIFAPAGLGVRELVLAAGLSPFMGFQESLLIAAALRMLTLVADSFVAGSIAITWAAAKRDGSSNKDSA